MVFDGAAFVCGCIAPGQDAGTECIVAGFDMKQ
jgi:hypothetical protein